jgi:hypothetical protein
VIGDDFADTLALRLALAYPEGPNGPAAAILEEITSSRCTDCVKQVLVAMTGRFLAALHIAEDYRVLAETGAVGPREAVFEAAMAGVAEDLAEALGSPT